MLKMLLNLMEVVKEEETKGTNNEGKRKETEV
jgi:hypothetical protein